MKIKVNDTVKIIAGKNRGKEGKVIQILPKLDKVVVEGANVMVKHLRSRSRSEKGQKVEFFGPVHVSNVKLIDPKSKKPTRVGYKVLEDGSKKRMSKVSKEIID